MSHPDRLSALAKFSLVLLTLAVALLADLRQALALLALGLIMLSPTPRLLLDWLRLIARLAPLLIALLLMGLLFAAPFPVQSLMLARIAALLLASVWLARTTRLEQLVAELHPFRRIPVIHDGLWYLVGTILWLPVIGEELRKQRERTKSWKAVPGVLVEALSAAMTRMDEIEHATEAAFEQSDERYRMGWRNLLLLLPATLEIAIIIFVQ